MSVESCQNYDDDEEVRSMRIDRMQMEPVNQGLARRVGQSLRHQLCVSQTFVGVPVGCRRDEGDRESL